MRLRLALIILLTLSPTAPAATVQLTERTERDGGRTYVYASIEVLAPLGERNALEVTHEASALVVRDAGAELIGHGRCRNADPHTVVCDAAGLDGITDFTADLGDMDDSARATDPAARPYVRIRGGSGNDQLTGVWATLQGDDGDDRLTGGGGHEVLEGGSGDDVLEGHAEYDYLDGGAGADTLRGGDGHDGLHGGAGGGRDHLDGGPGNDSLDDLDGLAPGAPDADTLIGGDGRDFVWSYVLRRRAVTVDLTRPDGAGEAGENDALAGIEDVYGGRGADTLIGDAGPNHLDGDRGEDVLRGGGGDDVLVSDVNPREDRQNAVAGAYGPDRVFGEAGDDEIRTLATLESTIACGEGRDRVWMHPTSSDAAPSSLGPLVSRACERLSMAKFSIDPYPAFGGGALTFGVPAFRCCRQRLELQTIQRRPRRVATVAIRRHRVRARVDHPPPTLRGKVTGVAANRFVWRFRRGF